MCSKPLESCLFVTLWTVARQAPLCPWDSQGKNTGVGCHALLHRSSQPRDQTQVSCTVDSLPSEPPGKSKNIGVGSLSLLQGIFPSQEIEPGSSALQMDSLPAELPTDKIRKVLDVTPEKSCSNTKI